ncbi:MAG: uroporphyrinogen-III synthase [Nitrososphaerales archaeon]
MTAGPTRIQNVVITRSKKGNDELAADLRRRGFNPIAVDTISFLPPESWSGVDASLKVLGSYDWVVFTSVTGVEFFARRIEELSIEMPRSVPPSFAAVGKGTAGALSRLGVVGAFTPSVYLTHKLAEELPLTRGKRVLVLRADIADPALSETLRTRGFGVTEFTIYRTEYGATEKVSLDGADIIVFASPSSVAGFCLKSTASELDSYRALRVACIGPVTANAAREHGFKNIVTPQVQTFDSLIEEIEGMNSVD